MAESLQHLDLLVQVQAESLQETLAQHVSIFQKTFFFSPHSSWHFHGSF